MDAFELRDLLIAAMPDDWVGLDICTVYDEDHEVHCVQVAPGLSRLEIENLCDLHQLRAIFDPVMRVWLAAPIATRVELCRLLGANNALSDEDGASITRTELDLLADGPELGL